MYSIGLNLFQNVNTKRYMFYNELLKWTTQHGRFLSAEDIHNIGMSLGYSKQYIYNETLGCLYANFLTGSEKSYIITDRAVRDFSLYESEVIFKTAEIPYTISFRSNDIKLSYFHLAGMSPDIAKGHKTEKWSWNQSLKRVMRHCHNPNELEQTLLASIMIFDSFLSEYKGQFADFVREFGQKYRTSAVYSTDMNFRGLFQSKTIEKYAPIYMMLKRKYINPVDWGGYSFTYDAIECESSIKKDFLEEALYDGMIRRIDNNKFTLTGHSSIIIDAVVNEYHKRRISIIIRKKQDHYSLWLGCNSNYSMSFMKFITTLGFKLHDGWYVHDTLKSMEDMYKSLICLCNFFARDVEYN